MSQMVPHDELERFDEGLGGDTCGKAGMVRSPAGPRHFNRVAHWVEGIPPTIHGFRAFIFSGSVPMRSAELPSVIIRRSAVRARHRARLVARGGGVGAVMRRHGIDLEPPWTSCASTTRRIESGFRSRCRCGPF